MRFFNTIALLYRTHFVQCTKYILKIHERNFQKQIFMLITQKNGNFCIDLQYKVMSVAFVSS